MTQYYYSDGQNQFGPFNIDELKDKKISKDTLVWYEGLNEWTKASEIAELGTLFKSIPPPLTKTPPPVIPSTPKIETEVKNISSTSIEKKSSGKLTLYIIGGLVVIGLIAFGIFYKSNSTGNYNYDNYESSSSNNSPTQNYTPPPREKTPEELRQELYQKEKNKPKDYLSTTYSLKYKVLSGKDEISGRIYNAATMATFKDVVLIVTYSSGTDTELYREEYTVYDYVYPNSSTNFLIKTFSPKGTKKIGVYVKTAKAE